jgi:chromosome segregation ATPase
MKIFLFTIFIILFSTSPSMAFYDYVDEHGVTRYTDNINEVPIDQRYGKEEYNEAETPPEETPPETKNITDKKPPASADTKDKGIDYDAALESLKEKQQMMMKERKAIENEDDQLLKDKLKLKPGDDVEEYNEEAAKLKERTNELDEKREEFNSRLDALNAEIKEYNEKVAKKLETQLQEYEVIKSNQSDNQ